MKRVLTLVAVLGLVFGMTGMSLLGCTTAAENRAAFIRQNLPLVFAKNKTCVENVFYNSSYQSIADCMALKNWLNPTLEQLANTSFASETDIPLIVNMHNGIAKCREQTIKNFMNVTPGAIPILIQGYQAQDEILADLITRKITYGEALRKRSAVQANIGGKIQAQMKQLDNELAAAHYAELRQMDEAVNALSQWSYQQQTLMQNQQLNQQLINSMNRPVTTNCYRVGNSVQCTSY